MEGQPRVHLLGHRPPRTVFASFCAGLTARTFAPCRNDFSDQFRDGIHVELAIDLTATRFNRALADLKLLGDSLIGLALNHQIEHLSFGRRELGKLLLDFLNIPQSFAPLSRQRDAAPDRLEQRERRDGLLQDIDDAPLYGVHGNADVGVSGNEQYGRRQQSLAHPLRNC